jgi:UDP-glucuronate 4-epimerase
MNNSGNQIVLTGGAGFIGSHLAEALLRRGVELTIIDNFDDFYSSEWKEANLEAVRRLGECEVFRLDICDFQSLLAALAAVKPSAIVHLAARAGVRLSIEQPCLYERVNVAGTLNLLEICRRLGIPKFIFGSSSSVYGASSLVPFSEDQMELKPISPYAATKLAGEMMSYTYSHLYRLNVVCLRFFTVYGPRQRPDLAIHKFFSLLESGKPIPFFGDGSSGRDYTYVDDIVSGILAALDYAHAPTATPFDIFNLGNSHPVSLVELVAALEQVSGRQAILDNQALQPGDVPLTWANIDKAGRLLGYKPVTPLREGLGRFAEWHRSARGRALRAASGL